MNGPGRRWARLLPLGLLAACGRAQELAQATVEELSYTSMWNGLTPPRYQVVDLGPLGGDGLSGADALNDRGDAVGVSWKMVGNERAVLWPRGADPIDLGTPPGVLDAHATGINNAATVLGYAPIVVGFTRGPAGYRAFEWRLGRMTWPAVPAAGDESYARAVNERGAIAGWTRAPGGKEHATLWSFWSFAVEDLGTLGGGYSLATAINDRRTVAGDSTLAGDTVWHPFRWRAGKLEDLGALPGDTHCSAQAINADGEVVGWCADTGKAFRVRGTTMEALPSVNPAAPATVARGMNNHGDIVGDELAARALLWTPTGAVYDLNTLIPPGSGWVLDSASDINEQGPIVGVGLHLGAEHGFLLEPR